MSIFLFALSSGVEARQDWRMEALSLEREAFESTDPFRANDALLRKAAVLGSAGEYSLALETLERVRMSIVEPAGRDSLTVRKAEFAFRAGEYERSFALLEEAGRAPSILAPAKHSEALAIIFALPAGYIMGQVPVGKTIAATAVNFGLAAASVLEILEGNWVTGLLGGGILLSKTYPCALEKARLAVEERNSREAEDALCRALEDYFGK